MSFTPKIYKNKKIQFVLEFVTIPQRFIYIYILDLKKEAV